MVYTIEQLKDRIAPVASKYGLPAVYVFGSYAKGEAAVSSDIDIMVDSGLRGLDFVGLIEYVREALEKNVDLIDIHYVDRDSSIEKEINSTGISIYGG